MNVFHWQRISSVAISLVLVVFLSSCGDPSTDCDHIVPKAEGGSDDRANLQGLCRYHHRRKTGKAWAAQQRASGAYR